MWVTLLGAPLFGQTAAGSAADAMLMRLRDGLWDREYVARAGCDKRVPVQMDIYATQEWSYHCADVRDGIVRESYYYVFGGPARTARLRVDVRPVDESPQFTAELLGALRERLTKRFGDAKHDPELMEIGFRRVRYGQPVAGDHWSGGGFHYFLHANQSRGTMGMRKGVQLVVMQDRLMEEREKDAWILRAEGVGLGTGEEDALRVRLADLVGAPYVRALNAEWKTPVDRERMARQTFEDSKVLLQTTQSRDRALEAVRLLAADALMLKLAALLVDSPAGGEREAAAASVVRRTLSGFGVKLGHMTHNGGLEYHRDLLWRVWREYPDTEAGEMAFVQLQRLGWNTDPREGCPPNPDLFREVIVRGEEFLRDHPRSSYRMDVAYTVAVANESWWSIAQAPADDAIVSAPPYPRRERNAREAGAARERAIEWYREVVRLAPASPEAASALRRLPRLELNLDTGQRRFYCFYC